MSPVFRSVFVSGDTETQQDIIINGKISSVKKPSLIQFSNDTVAFQLSRGIHFGPPLNLKKFSTLAEPTTESQTSSAMRKLKRTQRNCLRSLKR